MSTRETKPEVLAAFADALRASATTREITPAALAKHLGVTVQYAHKLWRGDGYPSPFVQARLRQLLGISFDAVLDSIDCSETAANPSDRSIPTHTSHTT